MAVFRRRAKIYYVVAASRSGPEDAEMEYQVDSRVGPDCREAENRLAEIGREYEQGRYREDEKMTVTEYLQRWLEDFRQNLGAAQHLRKLRVVDQQTLGAEHRPDSAAKTEAGPTRRCWPKCARRNFPEPRSATFTTCSISR